VDAVLKVDLMQADALRGMLEHLQETRLAFPRGGRQGVVDLRVRRLSSASREGSFMDPQ
jgi:hypothetical protein